MINHDLVTKNDVLDSLLVGFNDASVYQSLTNLLPVNPPRLSSQR